MINVALFGFGRIGQMHAENLNKNKEIKLLYVYEKIDQLSNKAKKLYGCKIEKNYNKIFNDKKVDIVFISSPTNTHIKFIEEGMKRKKTIFCEKPLDLNINKIIKTLKKIKKIKPKIQLGFNRRYDPGHFWLKKDLEKNKIGKLEKSDGYTYIPKIHDEHELEEAEPIIAEPGDVLFFHCFSLHGSMPNVSKNPRKTILIQLYAGTDKVLDDNPHSNIQLVLRGFNYIATCFSV